MATRDLLPLIRAARAGNAAAQVALGRHYLFGGSGLPRNIVSALHWLERAARQQAADAWELIGEHIPYEVARHAGDKSALLSWYDKAFESGVQRAGLTLTRLVMDSPSLRATWRARAMRVLRTLAQAGSTDAQRLLVQYAPDTAFADMRPFPTRSNSPTTHEWAASAADAGIPAARHALAEQAWAVADYAAFLRWSLPLAREVMQRCR